MAQRKAKAKPRNLKTFDPKLFLSKVGIGRTVVEHAENAQIFSQGDPAIAVFFIQRGRVKLTVLSRQGKEAVIGILGAGDFFGEGCLAGQKIWVGTATAISPTTVLANDRHNAVAS